MAVTAMRKTGKHRRRGKSRFHRRRRHLHQPHQLLWLRRQMWIDAVKLYQRKWLRKHCATVYLHPTMMAPTSAYLSTGLVANIPYWIVKAAPKRPSMMSTISSHHTHFNRTTNKSISKKAKKLNHQPPKIFQLERMNGKMEKHMCPRSQTHARIRSQSVNFTLEEECACSHTVFFFNFPTVSNRWPINTKTTLFIPFCIDLVAINLKCNPFWFRTVRLLAVVCMFVCWI